jgi:phospholipase/carboxylesterase
MTLSTLEKETGANPRASIIILHGLGADGSDFLSFVQELKLQTVGPVRFVFPNASKIPVTINGGHVIPAWYDISNVDLQRREDETGLRQSQQQIAQLIDHERARGISSERIVLAGFSQGCAMTLMTGLRYPHRLAGLVCMSGYLPLAETTLAERHSANKNSKIFMAHGVHDNVVPLSRGQASQQLLRAQGDTVQWHEYPMAHSVCAQEVLDLNGWLLQVLAHD